MGVGVIVGVDAVVGVGVDVIMSVDVVGVDIAITHEWIPR